MKVMHDVIFLDQAERQMLYIGLQTSGPCHDSIYLLVVIILMQESYTVQSYFSHYIRTSHLIKSITSVIFMFI